MKPKVWHFLVLGAIVAAVGAYVAELTLPLHPLTAWLVLFGFWFLGGTAALAIAERREGER